MTLTVGDAFSGIGGMSLGLRMCGGFETRWFIEIDEWCRRVLAKHWPDVPQYGDIRDVRGSELESIDVLTAGFPCQPVSLAGRGLAQADERWLWPEVARLVRELRPRWVLLENVPGLLGRGFGDVLGDLAACGYDAEWDCIPACAVGAHHIRDRVWIVAYPNGTGSDLTSRLPVIEREGLSDTDGARRRSTGESRADVADAASTRRHAGVRASGRAVRNEARRTQPERLGGEMADTDREPLVWTTEPRTERATWPAEPAMGRVVDGVSSKVDRDDIQRQLAGYGNAVVPLVVAYIGRLILEAEATHAAD